MTSPFWSSGEHCSAFFFVVPPTARLHQGCWLCFIRESPGLVAVLHLWLLWSCVACLWISLARIVWLSSSALALCVRCMAAPALSSAASSGILLRTGSLLLRECGQGLIPWSEVVSGRSSLLVCLFVRDGCQTLFPHSALTVVGDFPEDSTGFRARIPQVPAVGSQA